MFCSFADSHLWIARDALLTAIKREPPGTVQDALRGALTRIEDKLGLSHTYPTRKERRRRKVT